MRTCHSPRTDRQHLAAPPLLWVLLEHQARVGVDVGVGRMWALPVMVVVPVVPVVPVVSVVVLAGLRSMGRRPNPVSVLASSPCLDTGSWGHGSRSRSCRVTPLITAPCWSDVCTASMPMKLTLLVFRVLSV